MGDRTGYRGTPMLAVGAVELLRSVGEGQFDDGAESALLAVHPFEVAFRDNLVGPPTRRHLCHKDVLLAFLLDESIGDVVGERAFGLGEMGEARPQDFLADELSVEEKVEHTECRCHPSGRLYLLFVGQFEGKPACPVGGTLYLVGPSYCHGCVFYGNPLCTLPSRIVEGLCALSDTFLRHCRGTCHEQDYQCYVQSLHILFLLILNVQFSIINYQFSKFLLPFSSRYLMRNSGRSV